MAKIKSRAMFLTSFSTTAAYTPPTPSPVSWHDSTFLLSFQLSVHNEQVELYKDQLQHLNGNFFCALF